jgi:hypothetical protein
MWHHQTGGPPRLIPMVQLHSNHNYNLKPTGVLPAPPFFANA